MENIPITPCESREIALENNNYALIEVSLVWLRKAVDKKRKYTPTITIVLDIVAKMLQTSSRLKKANKMSRILIDPTSGNQMLEISDPIKYLNENEITIADYNVTHVDTGP